MGDNWKKLPGDVLLIIVDYFNKYSDYVRFRAVCASWRSNLPKWPKQSYYNVPWLMLPDNNYNKERIKFRGLYNPLNVDEVYYLELPEIIGYGNLRGFANGWLVTLEEGVRLKLLHPLTMCQIQLPPTSSFPDIKDFDPNRRMYTILDSSFPCYTLCRTYVHLTYIKKIVLPSPKPCANNDSSSIAALAIYGPQSRLAFTKLGDDKWTNIPTSLKFFHDCIFFDQKIYAIDQFGQLGVSPIDHLTTQMVKLDLRHPKFEVGVFNLFLVKRDDDLLLVERLNRRIIEFNIYKLESDEWVEIKDLDGYTIFLGRFNASICISSPGLEGNTIYFTFDKKTPFVGIFDIKDRRSRCLLQNDPHSKPPVWPHPFLVGLNPC